MLDERFIEMFNERAVLSEVEQVDWVSPRSLTLPTPPASVVDDPKDDVQLTPGG